MKYIYMYVSVAMLISTPAFAQIDLFVDGEKQFIPANRKLVIVPRHWDVKQITFTPKTPVLDMPKPVRKCDGELVISPGVCTE
jgi:hypothetical protein